MGILKIKPVIRTNKRTKDGLVPIYFRFTKNRKSSFQSSGIQCQENEWNTFDNCFWTRKPTLAELQSRGIQIQETGLSELIRSIKINPLAKQYNQQIINKLAAFENKKMHFSILDKSITSSAFKKEIQKGDGDSDESFIKFWQKRIHYFEYAESTSGRSYRDTLHIFLKFTRDKDVRFSDINIDFVNRFNAFLRIQKSKTGEAWSEDYVYKIIKCARATYNQAIKDGIYETDRNPFIGRVKRPNSTKFKEHLNKDEINSLIDLELVPDSFAWHVRNSFVFAVSNAGIRISDILLLRWENIKNKRVDYTMKKTKDRSSLPLNELSANILDLYKTNKQPRNFIFPFLRGLENETDFKKIEKALDAKKAYINLKLKDLAKLSKIDKHLTTHVARHSYAGFTIEANANPATTRNILKHKEQKTTDRYIGAINTDLIDSTHLRTMEGVKSNIA